MILRVEAKPNSFRAVKFEPGLNVVLAHRTAKSARRGTRNGLGKTTLLRIVHFCMGGSETLKEDMRESHLENWQFTLELLIGNEPVSVSRSLERSSQVVVNADSRWLDRNIIANPQQSSLQQTMDLGNLRGERKLAVSQWRRILGNELYNLKSQGHEPHPVVFEGLIGYDARLNRFDKPFEFRVNQYRRDVHLCNAYMLGLNWQFASKWQEIKRREDAVKSEQNKLRQDEHLSVEIPTSIGELETERDRLQRVLDRTDADLSQFRVHPQYVHIETEANYLTRQLHDLSNRILQLKRLIDFHDESMREDRPASERKVVKLYEEAGSALSIPVVRRLEDVRAFHTQITRNRHEFLLKEVSRLNEDLENTIREREQLSETRAELMAVLDTHGAIEEYTRIQQLNEKSRSELEAITTRIEELKRIETETSKINIEREQLFLDARIDLDEKTAISKAREIFDSNTHALYERAGKLIVHLDPNAGYKFDVDISRSGSTGVDKMKVFCYDLMRAELWSKRDVRPGFLIHDSTLFADVDERQVARALELGEQKSRECGFQYIVCLNSDNIPHSEFSEGFEIDKFVRLKLTDNEPCGRLLGIEF